MSLQLLTFAILTFASTFIGGLFALKFKNKDRTHLITSFSAGIVLGLSFFDLLPESMELSGIENISSTTTFIAFGFILYLILDRLFHNSKEIEKHDHLNESHIEHGHRGTLRATSLIFHSFIDGVAIGFAFQVSTALGVLVAVAVLAHDFSDGINTVTAILKSGMDNSKSSINNLKNKALKFLTIDALAPIVGVIFTLFFTVSESVLGTILAVFCGFFLYIGASDLIPESYHSHPTKLTTFMTILGMLFMFVIIQLAH
jgi:ZIP family zinc transporter